jgi:hypothetical protein
MKQLLASLVGIFLITAGAAPALATTPPRYASPSGTSAESCATPATACDITTAVDGTSGNNPVYGQEVIIEPGTYTLSTGLAPTVGNLNVHGVAGEPRPVIQATSMQLLDQLGSNEDFSYLEFDQLGTTGDEAISAYNGVLDGLLIKGQTSGNLCQCYGGTLRNSVLVESGTGAGAAWGLGSNGGASTETLRNDTLIATGASDYAMFMDQYGSPSSATTIDAKNVIALNTAGGHDVYSYGPMATIDMADSDYSKPETGGGGVLTNGGANITAAPVFLNEAGGDYRELSTSPTVDAGTNDTTNDGTLDFAGSPRLAGSRTDIGAFEYQPPAAVRIIGGQGQSATVAQAFGQPLAIEVVDAQGNPVPDVPVTFSVPASGASAAFAGSSSVHLTVGSDGTGSVPAPTAGSTAGSYTVSASAGGASTPAAFSLRNLPGAVASLKLTAQSASVAAAAAETFSVEAFDKFGNDAGPASSGVSLSIAPDGSCASLQCSALAPGSHTVTATLGSSSATATFDVTSLPPTLTFTRLSVAIARRARSGSLAARCAAPAGEVCKVAGKLTIRVHRRIVVCGSVSGSLHAGTAGRLQVKLTAAGLRRLRARATRLAVSLAVTDVSGHGSRSVTLKLSRARH